MPDTVIPWLFFVVYLAAIIGLTWRQRRKATSMESFAVGSRRVPPFFIGLSLAANMTSVATFVINPGLIHAYGWVGVVGYGMAAPLGIFLGLIVTTKSFRNMGDGFTALTIPQWIGERYGDTRLRVFFAAVSLLQISFLVLIVAALVHVLMSVLQLPMLVALVLVVAFTFAYILLGVLAAGFSTLEGVALACLQFSRMIFTVGSHVFEASILMTSKNACCRSGEYSWLCLHR
jgi:SSS family solute:Na+ symporter/sodium/pantothenate symporter